MSNKPSVIIDAGRFDKYIRMHSKTSREFSEELGFHHDYFSHCKSKGFMPVYAVKTLEAVYGGTDFFIVEDKPEVVPEQAKNVDLSGVINKIDELIVAVNKLGNIQMQQLQYIHSIQKNISKESEDK